MSENFIEDVAEDQSIILLDQSNDSRAQRIKTNTTAGRSNIAEAVTKISSKNPVRDFTRPLELLPDIFRNNNLATTNRLKDPSTNPSMTSSSAFKISGSIASDPEGVTLSLTMSDMKPEGIVKLNGSTLGGTIEGDDS